MKHVTVKAYRLRVMNDQVRADLSLTVDQSHTARDDQSQTARDDQSQTARDDQSHTAWDDIELVLAIDGELHSLNKPEVEVW
jgi:hypothetical protein